MSKISNSKSNDSNNAHIHENLAPISKISHSEQIHEKKNLHVYKPSQSINTHIQA